MKKFFVTDGGFIPVSDAHDTLEEAAEYAVNALLRMELHEAIVLGMESETFRDDLPAPIALILRAGNDLENVV